MEKTTSVLTIYRNEDQALVRPYELHIPAQVDTLAELCSFVTHRIPPKHELEILETGQVRQGEVQYGSNGSEQEMTTKTIKGYRFLYSVTGKPLWRVKECLDAKAIIVSVGPGYLPRTCSSIQTQLKRAHDHRESILRESSNDSNNDNTSKTHTNNNKRSKANRYSEKEFTQNEGDSEEDGVDVLTRPFHDTLPHATAQRTNSHSYRNSQNTCNDFTTSSHVSSASTLKESPHATISSSSSSLLSHVDSSFSSVEFTRNSSQTHAQSHHTHTLEPSTEYYSKKENNVNSGIENKCYSALSAPLQYEPESWQNASSPSSDNTDLANIRVSINLATPTLYPPSTNHYNDDDDGESRAVSINTYHGLHDVLSSSYKSNNKLNNIIHNINKVGSSNTATQDDEAQIRRFLFTDKLRGSNTGLQVTPPSRLSSETWSKEEEPNGKSHIWNEFILSGDSYKNTTQENVNTNGKTVISPALSSLDTESVNVLHHTSTLANKPKKLEQYEENNEYKFTSFVEIDDKWYGIPVAPLFTSLNAKVSNVSKTPNEVGNENYIFSDDLDAGELDLQTRLSLLLMRKWGAFAHVYKHVNVKAMLNANDDDKSDSESKDECDSINYNTFNKTHSINPFDNNYTQHDKTETNSNIIFGLNVIRRKYASFMKEYHTHKKQQEHLSFSPALSSESELEPKEKANGQETKNIKQSALQSQESSLRIIVEGPAFSGVSTTAALLSIHLLQSFKHGSFFYNTLLLPIDFKTMLCTHCSSKSTEYHHYFESKKEEEELEEYGNHNKQKQQQQYSRLSQRYLAKESESKIVFTNKTITTMLHSILHLTFDAIAVQRPRLRREIWTLCEVWQSVFEVYKSTFQISNRHDEQLRSNKMFAQSTFGSKEYNEIMNRKVCNKVNGPEWNAKLHHFPSLSFCSYPQAIVLVGRNVLTQWDTFAQAAFPLLLAAVHYLNQKEEMYSRQHAEQSRNINLRRKKWYDEEESQRHFRSTRTSSFVEDDKVKELYSAVIELIYCTLPITIASSLEFKNVFYMINHVHELLPVATDNKSNSLNRQYQHHIFEEHRSTKKMQNVNSTLHTSHSWSVHCAKAFLQRLWSHHHSVHLLIAWPHSLPFNETLLLPSPTNVVKTIGLLSSWQVLKQALPTPINANCFSVNENRSMKPVNVINPLDPITLPRYICARNTLFSIDVFLGAPGYLSLLVQFLQRVKIHNTNSFRRVRQEEEQQQLRLNNQNKYHTTKQLNENTNQYSSHGSAAFDVDQEAASVLDSGNTESVGQNLEKQSSGLHEDMCQSGYVIQADYADLYSAFTELQKMLTKSTITGTHMT